MTRLEYLSRKLIIIDTVLFKWAKSTPKNIRKLGERRNWNVKATHAIHYNLQLEFIRITQKLTQLLSTRNCQNKTVVLM